MISKFCKSVLLTSLLCSLGSAFAQQGGGLTYTCNDPNNVSYIGPKKVDPNNCIDAYSCYLNQSFSGGFIEVPDLKSNNLIIWPNTALPFNVSSVGAGETKATYKGNSFACFYNISDQNGKFPT